MSYIKTKTETDIIIKGGLILGRILDNLAKMSAPGISTLEIDKVAFNMIKKAGGKPAFLNYKIPGHTPFPGTICASINDEIVHGIPKKNKILNNGDIFSIDIGMQWPLGEGLGLNGDGFFTDTALTVFVGEVDEKIKELVGVTKKALEVGILACRLGSNVADIGRAIEDFVTPHGYGIVRDLVGHGVGHDVHEEPHVPNYYSKEMEQWELREGVVLALEPMFTLGTYEIDTAEDGWGVVTADRSLSAHFEHTVVITADGPVVATRRPSEK